MRVLLTGSTGQLGQALRAGQPAHVAGKAVELIATSRTGGPGLRPLDLADPEACRAAVLDLQPDWIFNVGAYTAVDQAEQQPDLAERVNAGAPLAFAQAAAETDARVLQLSTDFVFNGGQGSPYRPDQACQPLGVYGATKAKGEEAVQATLGAEGRGVILRTSWVMGPVGRNFLTTMLRLHHERDHLGVVADQVGSPTSTLTLAAACWQLIQRTASEDQRLPDVLHWSDAGVASWYDVAVAVGELGTAAGLLARPAQVKPITTADYPTPAQRPPYSVLDCSFTRSWLGLPGMHWRTALNGVMAALAAA